MQQAQGFLPAVARDLRKAIPWSTSCFFATIYLNKSLASIIFINCLTAWCVGLLTGPWISCQTYLTSTPSHFFSASLWDFSISSSSVSLTIYHLLTSYLSWSKLPQWNELPGSALVLGTLFTSTNYITGAPVVVSLATHTTWMDCYGQWSFIFKFFWMMWQFALSMMQFAMLTCCLQTAQISARLPPSSLLAMSRVMDLMNKKVLT